VDILFFLLPINYFRTFGILLIVRKQRVQILTVREVPLISRRRRCTLSTKRRRVRCCEWGTLLPYIGFRSQISQRPAAISISLPDVFVSFQSQFEPSRVIAIHPRCMVGAGFNPAPTIHRGTKYPRGWVYLIIMRASGILHQNLASATRIGYVAILH